MMSLHYCVRYLRYFSAFLLRDAMIARYAVTLWSSVCSFVRLSVTSLCSIKTVKHIIAHRANNAAWWCRDCTIIHLKKMTFWISQGKVATANR